MKYFLLLPLFIFLSACDSPSPSISHGDLTISEANEIWDSQKKQNYAFNLNRTCECSSPYYYTVLIMDRKIKDVLFEKKDHLNYESKELIINNTRTIDELFEILKSYENSAFRFEVEFHNEFGYPTKIFIDPSQDIADEEIILELSNYKSFLF